MVTKEFKPKHYKVSALPTEPIPNAIIYVLDEALGKVRTYITTKTGEPIPLLDLNSGSGGGITAVTSTGNTINVTSSGTVRNIEIHPSLVSLINSALQSGDNVSELLNDAGYITLADVPTFDPTDYDLNDFNNSSSDPFARQSDIVGGGATNLAYTPSPTQGTVTSDTGTDATIPLVDATNAGLISSTQNSKIDTAVQPSDLNVYVPYTGATTNVDLGNNQIKVDQLEFDQTPVGTFGVGKVRWNDTDGTTERRLKGNNVTLQDGQEIVKRVVNKTGANLLESEYKVVRLRSVSEGGAQGQRSAVVLAQANTNLNSKALIGVVTENIANNQEGFITLIGEVRDINTTGSLQSETWIDGDQLYLSPTVAGGLTNVVPSSPNYSIPIATVDHAHATQGKISVHTEARVALDVNLSGDNDTSPSVTAVKTYIDAKVVDSITNGVTTIAPSQNAVFDALATKQNSLGFTPENVANKTINLTSPDDTKYPTTLAVSTALGIKADKSTTAKLILMDTTPLLTAVTGGNNILVKSWLIPANTFVEGAKYDFEGIMQAITLNNTKSISFNINTTNNMSGATQIGRTTAMVAGADYLPMKRQYVLRSGNLIGISTAFTNTTDESVSTAASNLFQSSPFDRTIDNYFIFAMLTANAADTFNLHSMEINETIPKTTI